MATITELRDQITERVTRARDIAALAEQESRDFSDTERAQITGLMTEAKAIKADLLKAEGDADLRAQLGALGIGMIDSQGGTTTPRPTPVVVPPQGRARTLGQQFLETPEYRDFLAQYARGGAIPDSVKGLQSRPAFFNTLLTGAGATSAGALTVPDDSGIVVPAVRQVLTLRDLVVNGTTSSDAVDFVRVTSETNAAAPVAEATATTGTSGTKPESAMALVRVTEPVKTIAHWIPATKRAVSDAGQLRTLIDNFLRYGLEATLENQMLNGDGVGENFTGILNTVGTQTQAWVTDIFVTTRKGITLVQTVGGDMPTAFVLNPTDWETIDLARNGAQDFYGAGPFGVSPPRLWGLPVVLSQNMPVGVGLVGNFRQVVLWDREQANISVSDSHAEFFVRNLLAILAELRAALTVLKPVAFVELDLTAA